MGESLPYHLPLIRRWRWCAPRLGPTMMRSWRADGGANAVEFALVLPILLVLLFGLLYGGLVLNEQQQISHAAREASRFGATFASPQFPAAAAFQAVADRASTTSSGVTNRDTARLCVMFWDGATVERHWYNLDDATPLGSTPPNSECPEQITDPTADPWIQVSIRMPTEIQAVFVTMTPTLGTDAVSVYEQPGT